LLLLPPLPPLPPPLLPLMLRLVGEMRAVEAGGEEEEEGDAVE
jgi:hypothetical protein